MPVIKTKKEYSILPQSERDEYHHHVRTAKSSNKPCCFIPLLVVTIIFILFGAVALTISLFYAEPFSKAVHTYWEKASVENSSVLEYGNSTSTGDQHRITTQFPVTHSNSDEDSKESEENENSAVIKTTVKPKSKPSKSKVTLGPGHNETNLDSENNDYNNNTTRSSKEEYIDDEAEVGNGIGSGNEHLGILSEGDNQDIHVGKNRTDIKDAEEKFAEYMRMIVKHLEAMTGIHRAEFVIPLFMLICFMTSLTVVSLCCCMMMKRRENRRRKLFGKIITDLQTGDSKTVLLNQDQDD